MTNWGKVAVGTRIGQRPDPVFFSSWTKLIACGLRSGDAVLDTPIALPHAVAADNLVHQFLGTSCDSILFVDDDVVFDQGALEVLRSTETDCSIISGLVTCRRGALRPIALRDRGDGQDPRFMPDHNLAGVDVLEVDVVGFGFTLIHRSVFESLATLPDRETMIYWHNDFGEDGELCMTAKALGHRVGVCPLVNVGHRVGATARWNIAAQRTDVHVDK